MTHTTHHLYVEAPHESVTHLAAPASDAAHPPSATVPNTAAAEPDENAWAAWQVSTFTGLATATPVTAPQSPALDPSTAAFDEFERATFPGLDR